MSKLQVFVRQRDDLGGWAVDVYDGKGQWRRTIWRAGVFSVGVFNKTEAQKRAREIRAEARPPRNRKTR